MKSVNPEAGRLEPVSRIMEINGKIAATPIASTRLESNRHRQTAETAFGFSWTIREMDLSDFLSVMRIRRSIAPKLFIARTDRQAMIRVNDLVEN